MRLASAITFLALVGMLMYRTRDPEMWRWAARDEDPPPAAAQATPPAPRAGGEKKPPPPSAAASAAASPADKPGEAKPEDAKPGEAKSSTSEEDAAVGTDLDPEEADAIREEFEAVNDRTLLNGKAEMEAYYRVLRWVDKQSLDAMRARAQSKVRYNDLAIDPDRFRGKLVQLRLNIRRIIPCEKTSRRENPPYEVWGFTSDSQAWLYCAVVPELPEGMPVGDRVMETAWLVGYFFKLQGYYPATAKPNEAPLYAPLILGRLEWVKPTPVRMQSSDWKLIAGAVGVLALVGVGSLIWTLRSTSRRGGAKAIRSGPRPLGMSAGEWLDQAESGALPGGNNLDFSPDVQDMEVGRSPPPNGNGQSHPDAP